jgi:hypothetical protein
MYQHWWMLYSDGSVGLYLKEMLNNFKKETE